MHLILTPSYSLCGLFMDHFNPVIVDVDRILGSVKTTICALDLCSSWLVKTYENHVNESLKCIINQALTSGHLPSATQKWAYTIQLLCICFTIQLSRTAQHNHNLEMNYLFKGQNFEQHSEH